MTFDRPSSGDRARSTSVATDIKPGTVTTIGVDGFKGGWIAAIRDPGGAVRFAPFQTFSELVRAVPGDAVVAVDIPIGLPDRIVGRGRAAEQAVRPILRKRRSSLFPMPARAVVEAFGKRTHGLSNILEAHRGAGALAMTLSDPPRRIAIQGFAILPKIREVDGHLRADPGSSERIVESHPEVAFALLNGGQEMGNAKKTAAGERERKAVLVGHGLCETVVETRCPSVPEDDRLDALVMLLVADRKAAGLAVPYPDPPERDTFGLPIAIWV